MVTGTVGHPWIASFVACFFCVLGQVCPGVHRSHAGYQRLLVAPLLEFSFSCDFRVCPTFAVMLLLFGAVCSVFVGTGPVWKDACMDKARVYLRNAPVHALGPGLVQAEA